MALPLAIADGWSSTYIDTHDIYYRDENHTILIDCPNKGRLISATLTGQLQLNVRSNWQEFLTGSGSMLGDKPETADRLWQIFGGNSFRQAWFGRKVWQGTDPIKLRIPITFIAQTNAMEEVYRPVMAILALLYPRKLPKENNVGEQVKSVAQDMYTKLFDTLTEAGDTVAEIGNDTGNSMLVSAGQGFSSMSSSVKNTLNSAMENVNFYAVPGPTPWFEWDNASSQDTGDAVRVRVGNFLEFPSCYLTDADFTLSPAWTTTGNPMAATGYIMVESMDVAFVDEDGSFLDNTRQKTSLGYDAVTLSSAMIKLQGATLATVGV